jgi:hypothetical protein
LTLGKLETPCLTQGLKAVLIAVDWTQVCDFMILEATLVVAGRGIPFFRQQAKITCTFYD